jgi:hypothetical protein
MKRKTLFLFISALLCPFAARAQSTTQTAPPAQQPAKPYSSLDDDPQFKRLSPEQQELVRKTMASVDKAVAAEQNKPSATPKPAPAPNAQPGCAALPVKKPRFHLPKPLQDAIDKQTKQLGSKTGVALDPNAPAQAVNDAQKDAQGKPCPASPAPKPANQ